MQDCRRPLTTQPPILQNLFLACLASLAGPVEQRFRPEGDDTFIDACRKDQSATSEGSRKSLAVSTSAAPRPGEGHCCSCYVRRRRGDSVRFLYRAKGFSLRAELVGQARTSAHCCQPALELACYGATLYARQLCRGITPMPASHAGFGHPAINNRYSFRRQEFMDSDAILSSHG